MCNYVTVVQGRVDMAFWDSLQLDRVEMIVGYRNERFVGNAPRA